MNIPLHAAVHSCSHASACKVPLPAMHWRHLLSTCRSYQGSQQLTSESGHVQTSQEVLYCLDKLQHVPSAELATAACAWAEAVESSSKVLPAVRHASTAATGHFPHFTAEIQSRSKLVEVCLG